MLKKTTITFLVMVGVTCLIIASSAISNNYKIDCTCINSNTGSQVSVSSNNIIYSHNVLNTTLNKNKKSKKVISAEKAKKIAQKYILQPGAKAGTPKLVKNSGKLIYIVPVVYKNMNVGEIYIDAHTGKNLGGAGGAP